MSGWTAATRRRPRCSALHPRIGSHSCMKRAGHGGVHTVRAYGRTYYFMACCAEPATASVHRPAASCVDCHDPAEHHELRR